MTFDVLLTQLVVARTVRIGVLAGLLLGYLPIPVVHAHSVEGEFDASGHSERHLALFHAESCDEKDCALHVHFVPSLFLAKGGASDATGAQAPEYSGDELTLCASVQFDLNFAVNWLTCAEVRLVAEPLRSVRHVQPLQFLQTYACVGGLPGLIGVCLC